jgi:hypothetical protein
VSTASAAPAAPAAPAGTVTHYYSLAASAFSPDGLHGGADYLNQWFPAALSNQDTSRCFNAGVSLPNGARLKSVTVYYTAGSQPMDFQFIRQELASNTATLLVGLSTSPSATPAYTSATQAIPTAYASVSTADGYSAGVCPLADTTFSGLTISYTG